MRHGSLLRTACFLGLLCAPLGVSLRAQATPVGGEGIERWRESQLIHGKTTDGFLLRSRSSLDSVSSTARFSVRAVVPTVYATENSQVPFSLNDGALWAGRGASTLLRAGVDATQGRVRLLALPELVWSQNLEYPTPDPALFPPEHTLANPTLFTVPAGRSPFASPFHTPQQSIDLPIRFGSGRILRLRPGQTSLVISADAAAFGASTENEWWGPGRQNALILSDNAEGFPHLFARTRKPIETRIGAIEARWLLGGLSESGFFDSQSGNDLRSISMAAVTIAPAFERNLTIGLARSVYAPASNWGGVLGALPQVFANVGTPNAKPLSDTTTTPGRDQLASLFFRWVFPLDGLEAYGEWGRAELPSSLRDFLLFPNHSEAYVLGLQWLGNVVPALHGRLHGYAETTYLEQSTTYRYRPLGSWYTSRAVTQGYTNQGQVLGAAIGPGSDSQLLGVDVVGESWRVGGFVNRIRWLEDVHSQRTYDPVGGHGQCEHDVSLLPGMRASTSTRAGHVSASFSSGWRLNTFFENRLPYCPGDLGRDYRNKSFTLAFTPAG